MDTRHFGMDAEIQRPGWQTLAYYVARMKRLSNRQVTVHGLDTGIHAGMTAFLARQDLCITMSVGAWERSSAAISGAGQAFNILVNSPLSRSHWTKS